MQDNLKSKAQLIEELREARLRIAALGATALKPGDEGQRDQLDEAAEERAHAPAHAPASADEKTRRPALELDTERHFELLFRRSP